MKLIFCLATAIMLNTGYSQTDIIYSNFSATRVNNSIRIDFNLNAGATCYGISVERGNDSLNLIQIVNIPGQCGSPSEPIHFTYIDEHPLLNSKNHYRLNFGGSFYSETISIDFHVTAANVAIASPNPNSGVFKLSFENKSNETRQIEIVSGLGEVVYRTTSKGESTCIELPQIPKGIYYVMIYDENSISLVSKGIIIFL